MSHLYLSREFTSRDGKSVFITFRDDAYVNADDICQSTGKTFNEWMKLKDTNDIIYVVQIITDLSHRKLIDAAYDLFENMIYDKRGIFVHPIIALHFDDWCNSGFMWQLKKYKNQTYDEFMQDYCAIQNIHKNALLD